MRRAVSQSGVDRTALGAHPGLWWSRIAPLADRPGDGLLPEHKEALIRDVCTIPVPDFYERAFVQWRASVTPHAYTWELELTSRLLVGHGEPSAIGIGITLHPVYGVPYIPGSAVKGLLSHHLGRSGITDWQGVTYVDKKGHEEVLGDGRPVAAPGPWYAAVFGAPAITTPPDDSQGLVQFEDAWLVPHAGTVLEADVLTPHQKGYYGNRAPEDGHTWDRGQPIDWDDPNPVGFVTVRPGQRFLFALSFARGAGPWAELAFQHLADALASAGIGGKTSVGYGRFGRPAGGPRPPQVNAGEPAGGGGGGAAAAAPRAPASPALEAFQQAIQSVEETSEGKLPVFRARDFASLAAAIPPAERAQARHAFGKLASHPKIRRLEGATLDRVAEILGA